GARPAHADESGAPLRIGNARAAFFALRVRRMAPSDIVFEPQSRKWAGAAAAMETASKEDDDARVEEPLRSMLRPYQKRGVAWLRGLERGGFSGILADEMGLGKTVQTLAWLSLPRVNPAHRGLPALVVCPTSLVSNWIEEAQKFTPKMRVLAMHGESRDALMAGTSPGKTLDPAKFATALLGTDLVVASYATLRRDVAVYERNGFSACVVDEAQNIKNRTTQNAECVKRVPAALRLAVTGTPIENSPADLWSIEDFLMRGYLGDWNDFRIRYEAPIALGSAPDRTPQQWREARDALDRLRDLVRPYLLRRLKTDVAKDLPPKTVQVVFRELGPEQRAVYARYFKAARSQVSDALGTAGLARSRMLVLTALLRLRQAACHLALLGDESLRADPPAHPSAKLEWLMEFLEQAREEGHRVLVFSQFVEMLKLVRAALDSAGVKYCYLDGASKDRAEQVHLFNATASIPVFLISLKAGGTGLNLTGADEVVLFDPWWNPAAEDQAVDRAHRIGQTRNVRAIKLVARGTVEEKVYAMQRRKKAVIAATIQTSDEAALSALDESDVRRLFDL
ncbi:MAG: DEAD/DEAH box helicase, partial [Kiritimatiellae bacterium]|nr:DEAD/DEAH box helicase [Kiritimatiellia bacterium]